MKWRTIVQQYPFCNSDQNVTRKHIVQRVAATRRRRGNSWMDATWRRQLLASLNRTNLSRQRESSENRWGANTRAMA